MFIAFHSLGNLIIWSVVMFVAGVFFGRKTK